MGFRDYFSKNYFELIYFVSKKRHFEMETPEFMAFLAFGRKPAKVNKIFNSSRLIVCF